MFTILAASPPAAITSDAIEAALDVGDYTLLAQAVSAGFPVHVRIGKYPNAIAVLSARADLTTFAALLPLFPQAPPRSLPAGIAVDSVTFLDPTGKPDARIEGLASRLGALATRGLLEPVHFTRGCSPVLVALSARALMVCRLLLRQGCRADEVDVLGRTALHILAGEDYLTTDTSEVIQELVAAGAALDAVDKFGRTAVSIAAANGPLSTLSTLLALGASLTPASGRPPLSIAIEFGSVAHVRVLLEHGASLTHPYRGRPAFLDLVESRIIWPHGAPTGPAVAAELLRFGAPTEQKYLVLGTRRRNALQTCVLYLRHLPRCRVGYAHDLRKSLLRTIATLLRHGADVNSRDEDRGTTALHEALFVLDASLVHLLVSNGAKLDIADLKGQRPLDYMPSAGDDPSWYAGHSDVKTVQRAIAAGRADWAFKRRSPAVRLFAIRALLTHARAWPSKFCTLPFGVLHGGWGGPAQDDAEEYAHIPCASGAAASAYPTHHVCPWSPMDVDYAEKPGHSSNVELAAAPSLRIIASDAMNFVGY